MKGLLLLLLFFFVFVFFCLFVCLFFCLFFCFVVVVFSPFSRIHEYYYLIPNFDNSHLLFARDIL